MKLSGISLIRTMPLHISSGWRHMVACERKLSGKRLFSLLKSGGDGMQALRAVAVVCVLFATFTPNPAVVVDWTRFRGPGGLGISKEMGLPVTWSSTTNLVWKNKLPGAGASSPIAIGGKIFLTCYSGYGSVKWGVSVQRVII